MNIFGLLFVGLIAGWLAGQIMKSGGLGLVGNLAIGVIGAILGGYLFQYAGLEAGGVIGALVTATVGAILVLFVVGFMKHSQ